MLDRIRQMVIKEFLQTFRDPRMRGIILVAPVVQLLLFGYAVSTDVRAVPLAIWDEDHSIASRELVAKFVQSEYFQLAGYVEKDAEMTRMLDREEARMVLCFKRGFGAALDAGHTAPLQMIIDGTDSNTARVAGDYAGRVIRSFARGKLVERLTRLRGPIRNLEPVALQTRAWYNDNLESRNFFVPGVIASLITIITLMMTSMAVVREKEIGTLEQIIATPIRQFEFILGKTIPFVIVGYVDVALIVLVAVFWFEVPLRGSLWLLFGGINLYLMSVIGIGLLISTLCHTQQQAMMSTFFFFNPAMLLSGFVFPIANMPAPVQWLTFLNPMRYVLVIIRAIFLKGIGADLLWPQMLALFVLGLVTLLLAIQRMQKTLS